jgi:leucyl-tRNA synthetase
VENKKTDLNKELENEFNKILKNITTSIESFQFNVSIANFYKAFSIINNYLKRSVNNDCISKIWTKYLISLVPFIPHVSYECLQLIKFNKQITWPKIDVTKFIDEKIKFVIQVNGNTKKVLDMPKDLEEELVIMECKKIEKIKNLLNEKKLIKVIFIKNKIINLVIK